MTLAVYLAATLATACSIGFYSFALFRALTGAGIGGEYAAINSAIDELLPARGGNRADAMRLCEEALQTARASGIAFFGPSVLGCLMGVAEDPEVRRQALLEGEALLSRGALSPNHLWFRRDALEVALATADWAGVEHHARELERYTQGEPLPWARFFVARAWTVAAYRSGKKLPPPWRHDVEALIQQAQAMQHHLAIPALSAILHASDRCEQ